MDIGEMWEIVDHPMNLFHGARQFSPDILCLIQIIVASDQVLKELTFGQLSFRPPPSIIAILQDLYEHNAKCPMSERRRFDEVRRRLVRKTILY